MYPYGLIYTVTCLLVHFGIHARMSRPAHLEAYHPYFLVILQKTMYMFVPVFTAKTKCWVHCGRHTELRSAVLCVSSSNRAKC